MAAETILALQTIASRERSPLDPVVVTVGKIDGGTKRNIIPDEVRLFLTVRTFSPEVRKRVLESIERIAEGVALAAGVPEDRAPVFEPLPAESVGVDLQRSRADGARCAKRSAASSAPTTSCTSIRPW